MGSTGRSIASGRGSSVLVSAILVATYTAGAEPAAELESDGPADAIRVAAPDEPEAAVGPPGRVATDPEPALLDSDDLFSDDFGFELEGVVRDPFERVNRGVFRGNRVLDRVLLDPLTRGYRWILPDPARRSIRGVFENLGSPGVIVNDLLQGEAVMARDASARFLVNTTVGLAGIWDPAARIGYEAHSSDFGQTLGRAGWQSGPYLVLPLFGPNTARDLVGDVVDLALRPDTWLLPFASRLVIGSTDGISIRDANIEAVNALEASSVDFYAAMRSAFLMNRKAIVEHRDGAPDDASRVDGERRRAVSTPAPEALEPLP